METEDKSIKTLLIESLDILDKLIEPTVYTQRVYDNLNEIERKLLLDKVK